MTYEEIEKHYPEEFARRSIDKLAYRYPRYVYPSLPPSFPPSLFLTR